MLGIQIAIKTFVFICFRYAVGPSHYKVRCLKEGFNSVPSVTTSVHRSAFCHDHLCRNQYLLSPTENGSVMLHVAHQINGSLKDIFYRIEFAIKFCGKLQTLVVTVEKRIRTKKKEENTQTAYRRGSSTSTERTSPENNPRNTENLLLLSASNW